MHYLLFELICDTDQIKDCMTEDGTGHGLVGRLTDHPARDDARHELHGAAGTGHRLHIMEMTTTSAECEALLRLAA